VILELFAGSTVEMHGNIRFLVCPSCKARALMTEHFLRQLRSKKPIKCRSCEHGQLRCCILLYDDAEGVGRAFGLLSAFRLAFILCDGGETFACTAHK
jgi:NAD-dependent SIR2 family protein deacetylase